MIIPGKQQGIRHDKPFLHGVSLSQNCDGSTGVKYCADQLVRHEEKTRGETLTGAAAGLDEVRRFTSEPFLMLRMCKKNKPI